MRRARSVLPRPETTTEGIGVDGSEGTTTPLGGEKALERRRVARTDASGDP